MFLLVPSSSCICFSSSGDFCDHLDHDCACCSSPREVAAAQSVSESAALPCVSLSQFKTTASPSSSHPQSNENNERSNMEITLVPQSTLKNGGTVPRFKQRIGPENRWAGAMMIPVIIMISVVMITGATLSPTRRHQHNATAHLAFQCAPHGPAVGAPRRCLWVALTAR